MPRLGERPGRMVSTTIYVESDAFDALQALSERTDVPFAVFVRQGIDEVLLREMGVVASSSGRRTPVR